MMREVTTLCSLWKLNLRDGTVFSLTDHDATVQHEGRLYMPQDGALSGQIEQRAGLAVDSGGITANLFLAGLSRQDICDGALDGATLSQYRHDWRTGETHILSTGRVGEVSMSDAAVEIEWLGQASLLNRSTGRVFSRQCDASFCDTRCGLNRADYAEATDCPRSFTACRDVFDNTDNFRGFPYLLGDDALQAGVLESDPRDGSSRYT